MKCIEKEGEKNKRDREETGDIRERSMETIGETMRRDGRGKGKRRKSSVEIVDLME